MPKIRGVKPEFWTDDAIVELSIPARLLFIGMWNFACDNGHLDDKPKQIKMRIFPADDVAVDELLDELEEQRRITRKSGTITIPKFASHQKPHKRWWTTCDLPWCKVPDDASKTPANSPTTVEPQGNNGGPTADVTDVTDGDVDRGDSRRNRKRAPSKPLPEEWKPSTKHQEYADENGIDLSSEAFRFRNHAMANDRRQVDWDAAFRMWLSKSRDYGSRRPQPVARPAGLPESW